ncbi:hypothetical protein QFZ75_004192 [Streptomyces sp. V3I8]|nr:hypothetical protein [Streptomyces sp. V3I8]
MKPPHEVSTAMSVPPSIVARSRIPSRPWPAPGEGGAVLLGAELTTRICRPRGKCVSSTLTVEPGACRSALLSASWTIRYADSSTPGGSGSRSPLTWEITVSPAARVFSTRTPRRSRVGCGAWGAVPVPGAPSPYGSSGFSERSTPRTLRSSVSASRAFCRMPARFSFSSSEGFSTRCGATWAWMEMTDMWWATTSCSSRAMRLRSSRRVRRERSSAVRDSCSTNWLRASLRPRRAMPRRTRPAKSATATTPVDE